MPKGYIYILECSDGSFYTGSTIDLDRRLKEHNRGEGSNYTKTRLPLELKYLETYDRIDHAFNREKQIQGWSKLKKLLLIRGEINELKRISNLKNAKNENV